MEKERIEFLDVLRGFALFGILYAHFIIWYTGAALPRDVYSKYMDVGSGIALAVFGTFVLGKFFSIFSFLFGYSFFIQQQSLRKRDDKPLLRLSIRFFVLFIIGFLHQIIWRGDILMIYAVLGFLLIAFSPLPDKVLLIVAVLSIVNAPGIIQTIFFGAGSMTLPMEQEAQRYYELISHGSFADLMRDNVAVLPDKVSFQLESGRLMRTIGFFLLGNYCARKGWFVRPEANGTIYVWFSRTKRALLLFLLLAFLLFITGIVTFDQNTREFSSDLPLALFYEILNVLLAVFYILGGFILFQRRPSYPLKYFAYPGRLALTTYLSQTVLGILIFYPLGLGLFDTTSPAVNVLLIFPVFGGQIWVSKWWLRRFSVGPVEWIWKSLTQLRIMPMRKLRSSMVNASR